MLRQVNLVFRALNVVVGSSLKVVNHESVIRMATVNEIELVCFFLNCKLLL